MSIEGKTIARVIEAEWEGGDGPWIVFTDGTGISLQGWEDGADYHEETPEAIAEHEAKIAERAAAEAKREAEREAWMMRSCDERAEIRREWLASRPMNPKTFIPTGFEDMLMDDMVWDMNRSVFDAQPKVKARCPKCNERGCPNAPYMQPPNRGVFHQSGTFTIPVAKGKQA